MKSRRKILATIGTTTGIVLAGCLGDDESEDDDTGEEESEEDTGGGEEDEAENGSDESEHEGEPEYTIEGNFPEEVEIEEEFTFTITVSNDGDGVGPGPATIGATVSTADTIDPEVFFEDEIEVQPGETEEIESEPFSWDEPIGLQWQVYVESPETGETVDAEFYETEIYRETPELSFGESYESPEGFLLTIEEVDATSEYTYTETSGIDEGEEKTHEHPEDGVFVLVEVSVENTTDEMKQVPDVSQFRLSSISGDERIDPFGPNVYEADDYYPFSDELAQNEQSSGILPYSISAGSEENIQIEFSNSVTGTPTLAIWRL